MLRWGEMPLCAGCGEFGIFCRFHGCRAFERWAGVLRGRIAGGLPLYSTLPLSQNNTLGQVASVWLIPAASGVNSAVQAAGACETGRAERMVL